MPPYIIKSNGSLVNSEFSSSRQIKQVNFVVQFHTCLCGIVLLRYTISRLPQLQSMFQLVKCFIKSPRMQAVRFGKPHRERIKMSFHPPTEMN